jgi:uncharacterized protein
MQGTQTIGITGGTGFVGQHLTRLLTAKGYNVVIFTRSAARKTDSQVTYAHWDVDNHTCDINALKELDAVVHLAGAAIADKRLTEKRKKEVIDSRVNSTAFLLQQLKEFAPGCKTFVAASATGFYGPDRDGLVPFVETAAPYTDFLGETCRQWEDATRKAADIYRTVILRIGIVLGKEGGAYPQLAGPLKFGLMPILGSGKQMVSWIGIEDLARLFVHAIERKDMAGIYNGVAPAPVTHLQLMRTLVKVKGGFRIPAHAPAFVLRLLLGEMAEEVLKSCTVSAKKTLDSGFVFENPDIVSALKRLN